jgi:hypothetical protein
MSSVNDFLACHNRVHADGVAVVITNGDLLVHRAAAIGARNNNLSKRTHRFLGTHVALSGLINPSKRLAPTHSAARAADNCSARE